MLPCKGCGGYLQKIALLETTIFHLKNSVNNPSLPPSQNANVASAQNVLEAKLTIAKSCSDLAKLTLTRESTSVSNDAAVWTACGAKLKNN